MTLVLYRPVFDRFIEKTQFDQNSAGNGWNRTWRKKLCRRYVFTNGTKSKGNIIQCKANDTEEARWLKTQKWLAVLIGNRKPNFCIY